MSSILRKKLSVLALGFGTCIALLALRLCWLQVVHHHQLRERGQQNMLRVEHTQAPRGNITDCHGQLLATSRPCLDVYWEGSGAPQLGVLAHQALTLLEASPESVARAERRSACIPIRRDIDFALLAQLQERYRAVPNLVVKTRYERHYPARTLAAHVLGSVGIAQGALVGRSGIEQLFDAQLQGTQGYAAYIANSRGRRMGPHEHKLATPGGDIALCIDAAMQSLAQEAFPAGSAGAFVVMDAHSGAIKALCSMPAYDPNLFTRHLSAQDWAASLSPEAPLMCRATQARYPPASLFKLVTFAAGIEEGIISMRSSFYCNGATTLGEHTYACNRRFGHGRISASLAIAHSCNIPCYGIGKKIGTSHPTLCSFFVYF